MIEFIEKAPWEDKLPFTGPCTMHPTYMAKDGKEYFVFNRRGSESWWKMQDDAIKAELLANDGKYFRFNGRWADPFEMLNVMEEKGWSFEECYKLFDDTRGIEAYGEGSCDFSGNLNEVSAAFHYRIYDDEMIDALMNRVDAMTKKENGNDESVC